MSYYQMETIINKDFIKNSEVNIQREFFYFIGPSSVARLNDFELGICCLHAINMSFKDISIINTDNFIKSIIPSLNNMYKMFSNALENLNKSKKFKAFLFSVSTGQHGCIMLDLINKESNHNEFSEPKKNNKKNLQKICRDMIENKESTQSVATYFGNICRLSIKDEDFSSLFLGILFNSTFDDYNNDKKFYFSASKIAKELLYIVE